MMLRCNLAMASRPVAVATLFLLMVPVVNCLVLESLYQITGDEVIGRRGQVLSVKSAGVCSMT